MKYGKDQPMQFPMDPKQGGQWYYIPDGSMPPINFPMNMQESSEEEIDLRDYWRIIAKRKWLIISIFFVIALTTTIVSFMLTPVYRGEAVIQINPENPKILDFKEVLAIDPRSTDYYRTQYEKLKSHTLALKVIKLLDLESHPEFKPKSQEELGFITKLKVSVISFLKSVLPSSQKDKNSKKIEDKDEILVRKFLGKLKIDPIRNSRLVKIKFESVDPELAGKVPNLITDEFIKLNLEQRLSLASQAKEWLNKQIELLKAKVERSEEAVREFGRKHGIVSLDEKDENIVIQKLARLNEELTKAQADRIAKEALYNQAKGKDFQTIPAVLENELIKTLKADYIRLEGEYDRLSEIYKPEYPDMQQLKRKMDRIKSRLNQEINKIVNSLRADYEAALRREKLLQMEFEAQKRKAMRVKELAIQYNILKREADTNKELYDSLLQRMKETSLEAGLQSSNIQVVDRSKTPTRPVKPRKMLNILLSMVIGLFLGIGFAFFFEYLDNTVKTPEDIERIAGLPSLGMVPLNPEKKFESNKLLPEKLGNGEEKPASVELITYTNPKSLLSEAYKSIRTALLLSFPDSPPRSFVITSPNPSEGKTTCVVNMGIALAQTGKKVLIIDSDLRRPRLHKIFHSKGKNARIGLSSFLANIDAAGDNKLVKSTSIKNLSVIFSGPVPPDPTTLLSSERLALLIDKLSEHFDHIIFDAPPILGFADVSILSTQTEGALIVTASGKTPKESLKQATELLNRNRVKIIGVVVNGVDIRQKAYGYYYYQYHRYGYYGEK